MHRFSAPRRRLPRVRISSRRCSDAWFIFSFACAKANAIGFILSRSRRACGCHEASVNRRCANGRSATPSGWNTIACRRRINGLISTISGQMRPWLRPFLLHHPIPLHSNMRNPDVLERVPTVTLTPVVIGQAELRIEDVVEVARGPREALLYRDPAFVAHIERGAAFLDEFLDSGGTVYGVTTGYGDSCSVQVPPHLVPELPHHLVRYHGCGTGALLDDAAVVAVLMARLNSLARGYSGVRWILLERLEQLIVQRILPCIPSEGSVGASGDLTPLSYVAAVLIGEREVSHAGRLRPSAEVLRERGIAPLTLARKEGLAIMNGTAVMTALACLAWDRAEYLSRLATLLTTLSP